MQNNRSIGSVFIKFLWNQHLMIQWMLIDRNFQPKNNLNCLLVWEGCSGSNIITFNESYKQQIITNNIAVPPLECYEHKSTSE